MDGIDFSETYIRKCKEVVREEWPAMPGEEGELVSGQERSLAALGLSDAMHCFSPGRCSSWVWLLDYDLVLAGNLIDRLYKPSQKPKPFTNA